MNGQKDKNFPQLVDEEFKEWSETIKKFYNLKDEYDEQMFWYWTYLASDTRENVIQNKQDITDLTEIYTIFEEYKKLKYKQDNILTEEDFYPPPDDRVRVSYIYDIDEEHTYQDYLSYFYELYDDEFWN